MTTLRYQERFKTARGVFDEHTNRILFELQSRDVFEELLSPLEVGKESNVFLAKKGAKKVIVKIYRVQNCDYRKMFDYIRKDPRYEHLKQKRRDIIFAWVQREYRNLLKARQAKVLAPEPLAVMDNVLVEEMIGEVNPAPRLKDARPAEAEIFFDKVIGHMQKLYDAGLIHGDLSAFNILNDDDEPYFIDFSQATLLKTPNSEELLERDVKNVIQFFRKLGITAKAEEIIARVKKGGA